MCQTKTTIYFRILLRSAGIRSCFFRRRHFQVGTKELLTSRELMDICFHFHQQGQNKINTYFLFGVCVCAGITKRKQILPCTKFNQLLELLASKSEVFPSVAHPIKLGGSRFHIYIMSYIHWLGKEFMSGIISSIRSRGHHRLGTNGQITRGVPGSYPVQMKQRWSHNQYGYGGWSGLICESWRVNAFEVCRFMYIHTKIHTYDILACLLFG